MEEATVKFASDWETTASLKSSSDGDNLSAVVQMQWHHSKAAIPYEPGYFLGSACLTKLLGQWEEMWKHYKNENSCFLNSTAHVELSWSTDIPGRFHTEVSGTGLLTREIAALKSWLEISSQINLQSNFTVSVPCTNSQ